MRRLALLAALLALATPGSARAAPFALGVHPAASVPDLAADVERITGADVRIDSALRVLYVSAPRLGQATTLPGIAYAERLDRLRRVAFAPNDPFYSRQWYLPFVRAFDFWPQPPSLPGVRVAVIDSGIDARHPEFRGRIAGAKSFIGGLATEDRQGHGTFVAGEIAAATNNNQGIAAIGFPVQLLVAKVVRSDRTIPIEAEATAIRWAADNGARVINLSLAGVRDPDNPERDTFSALEASAVAYAASKGAVVVAAVGNGDQSPKTPWFNAGWPAALPHVLGVSALTAQGSVPGFSNRDAFYNDIAAPGEEIVSTLPKALTDERSACVNQGYSDCGPAEYRRAEGTSFAAPLVSAAAGLLLSVRPNLKSDQVTSMLTRQATDVRPENGCRTCPLGRDAMTGWGRLNLFDALSQAIVGGIPAADRLEPNDDAGAQARRVYGSKRIISATLDFWDDQSDVYAVRLLKGQRFWASLRGPGGTDSNLLLWRPGTQRVEDPAFQRRRVAMSAKPGAVEAINAYRVRSDGWYFVHVKISTPGDGSYTLKLTKRR